MTTNDDISELRPHRREPDEVLDFDDTVAMLEGKIGETVEVSAHPGDDSGDLTAGVSMSGRIECVEPSTLHPGDVLHVRLKRTDKPSGLNSPSFRLDRRRFIQANLDIDAPVVLTIFHRHLVTEVEIYG
jgi:hypothetical protein